MSYLFEVAVDSLESALIAQSAGANRIELCAALSIGGITPSHGMVKLARQQLPLPINVIIRPRQGDFLYSQAEFEMMRYDIDFAKSLNVNGVVIGILRPDGHVDIDRTRILIEQVRPLQVTFHRAFDMTADPYRALNDLIDLGVDTILTSGQQAAAEQGIDLITDLVKQADGRIKIMPGSGINPTNIKTIVTQSGATEFHFSGKTSQPSQMTYRNLNLSMGGQDDASEYDITIADEDIIRAIIHNAQT